MADGFTKRQVIKLVLEGKEPPYVPWSFRFAAEVKDALIPFYGTMYFSSAVDNHIMELGSDLGVFRQIDRNHFEDVFGVSWESSVDKTPGNVRNTVLKERTLRGYRFPDPLDKRFFDSMQEKIEKYGDRFRLYCIGFSLFERAWTLRGGMLNLMQDFIDAPDFVHELLSSIADYNIAQIREALKYDIDGVYFSDDWGQQRGLLMGKKIWKTFIYPQLKRMYRVVRDADKKVFIHSCGDVEELFEDLIGIGLNCYNPLQPEIIDIDTVIKKYRGRLSFWGGLSASKKLLFGSKQELIDETKRLIELGRQGNYILAASDCIGSEIPIENILAVIETCKQQKNYKS